MARPHAAVSALYRYQVRGLWPEPTLPLPAKCDYCGRDGGVNFVCDGCGAPRQARGEARTSAARVACHEVTVPFDDLVEVTTFGDTERRFISTAIPERTR